MANFDPPNLENRSTDLERNLKLRTTSRRPPGMQDIKTPFLGLEPYNTDTTLLLLFTFYNQENLGKFLAFYAVCTLYRLDFSDGHSLSLRV